MSDGRKVWVVGRRELTYLAMNVGDHAVERAARNPLLNFRFDPLDVSFVLGVFFPAPVPARIARPLVQFRIAQARFACRVLL